MITSRLLLTGLLLAFTASACRPDVPTSLSPSSRASDINQPLHLGGSRTQHVMLTRQSATPTPREQALIDRIIALHSTEAAGPLRSLLTNRFVQLHVPSGSNAQQHINELAAVRATEAAPAPEPVQATVLLVDQLSDPSASAIVIRRTNALPHDVILLPSGLATTEALGAGISALFKMRKSMGDVPTRDARVLVRDATMPRSWKTGLQRGRAEADLADLEQSAPRQVVGFGAVRAIDIPLRNTDARRHGAPPASR